MVYEVCEEEMMCMMSHTVEGKKPLLLWWLGNELGSMGEGVAGRRWQNHDFERASLRECEFIHSSFPRRVQFLTARRTISKIKKTGSVRLTRGRLLMFMRHFCQAR